MQQRFEGPFHQSDLKNYESCPRSFYYWRILGLDREKISMANLTGRAGHTALEWAHKHSVWDPDRMFAEFKRALRIEIERAQNRQMEVTGSLDEEKYIEMLAGYASKPWNRFAEVLLCEEEFYFEIPHLSNPKNTYAFEGRIDQLVAIHKEHLVDDFPEFRDLQVDPVIIHRDTKFGQTRKVSSFELALDIQFDIYGYALAYGVWPKKEDAVLGYPPHLHCKYHLQDHIPYKGDTGTLLKDENGNYIPCDIVTEPCLIGKKNEPCKGKRKWCTRQSRGPGMYFTHRPKSRLEEVKVELARKCSDVRKHSGDNWPRKQTDLCFNYCQYRSVCESEVIEALEIESLEAA